MKNSGHSQEEIFVMRQRPGTKAVHKRSVLAWRANISQKQVDLRGIYPVRSRSPQDDRSRVVGEAASNGMRQKKNLVNNAPHVEVKLPPAGEKIDFNFRAYTPGSPRLLTELARKEILDELADLEGKKTHFKNKIF